MQRCGFESRRVHNPPFFFFFSLVVQWAAWRDGLGPVRAVRGGRGGADALGPEATRGWPKLAFLCFFFVFSFLFFFLILFIFQFELCLNSNALNSCHISFWGRKMH